MDYFNINTYLSKNLVNGINVTVRKSYISTIMVEIQYIFNFDVS